ncbi:hypothetical protein K474DRAFT_260112 [Panus rudis PR-1116 ss-1]|nr:hypothetical protein K474DRAFT_260112 [Panus rudis PR-1116 ss-1]
MMSPARAASSDVKVQSFGNTQRSSNSTPAKGSFESLYAPSTARVRQTCTCKSSDGSSRHCTKEGCPRRRNLAGFRTPMALNYDILLVLMDHLERKTLLSLMQTSRMLYDAGIHQILSKPVTLGRRFKLRSFCSFMLVDYPSRLRHLRNVSIEKGFRPECGCLDTLCTLLSDAPHLETLEIARCDQFLQCNPELADAIASNPNIKSLRLDMAGDEGLAFLRRARCSLTSAAVLLTPPCLTGFPDMALEMSKFNSTLKDLSIQHSGILATKISSYRYPLVTSLTVEESDVRLPALAHMFPALRELTVYSFAYNIAQSDEEVEAIRKESKAWQVEAGMGWHHLDKLEGDVTSLYGLAPICKVDLVSGMLTSRNITRFAEVCRDTRPSTLKLYFHMDKCSVGELKDVLHASPDFRSLSITVDAIGLTQDLDFTKFFNDLRSVVGTTPVNTLYFRFTWHSGRIR